MKVSPQVCSSHQFPPMQILSLCCKFMKLLKWLKTPPYTPPRQIEAFVGQIIPIGHGHGRGRTNTSQFSSHGRGFVQTGQNSSRPALVMDTMLVKNRKNITFRPSLKKAITLRPSNIHKLNYALSVRYVENLVTVPLNVGIDSIMPSKPMISLKHLQP